MQALLPAFMIRHSIGVSARNQVRFIPADVADLTTARTGRQFEKFTTGKFISEAIRRRTREDPLFPLPDFFVSPVDKISSMEFKLYDSARYRAARRAGQGTIKDPP